MSTDNNPTGCTGSNTCKCICCCVTRRIECWLKPLAWSIYTYSYNTWVCCQGGTMQKQGTVVTGSVPPSYFDSGTLAKTKAIASTVTYIPGPAAYIAFGSLAKTKGIAAGTINYIPGS